MSKLLVVRHGQAQFFTDDYDRLSELGVVQACAVGAHWLAHRLTPDQVYCGTLTRQRNTARHAAAVMRESGLAFPEPVIVPGLDEYPSDEIMAVLLPQLRERYEAIDRLATALDDADTADERYRRFQRLLEAVMSAWLTEDYQLADNQELPSWKAFSGGVRNALAHIQSNAKSGATVAVFTSGGPIGVSVQSVLGAPQKSAIALNWRVHNGSVTEFTFSGERISLDGFNRVGHLLPDLLTYR